MNHVPCPPELLEMIENVIILKLYAKLKMQKIPLFVIYSGNKATFHEICNCMDLKYPYQQFKTTIKTSGEYSHVDSQISKTNLQRPQFQSSIASRGPHV